MKVFENHFEGKPTILINDRIINGCQNFTIDQLESVCYEFSVPDELKQDVLTAYTGESDTLESVQDFIYHSDGCAQGCCAARVCARCTGQ